MNLIFAGEVRQKGWPCSLRQMLTASAAEIIVRLIAGRKTIKFLLLNQGEWIVLSVVN
jgi:hypothetical protein